MQKEYRKIGYIVMNKQIHNSNVRPRNKVEHRRKSSKDIELSEFKPFKTKRKIEENNNKMEDDDLMNKI